jgi:hypothetical protein
MATTRFGWGTAATCACLIAAVGCDGGKSEPKESGKSKGDDSDDDSTAKKKKKKKNGKKADGETTAAATGDASAAAAPAPEPATFPIQKIGKGKQDGIWLGTYSIERVKGDTGKGYIDAAEHCRSRSKMLCTESQWEKACKAHSDIGKLESWTASFDGEQVIVRGGAKTGDGETTACDGRKTEGGGSGSPSRVAFCCDRAIAIKPSLPNPAFAMASHSGQLKYENLINSKDAKGLRLHYDEAVVTTEKADSALNRDAVEKQHRSMFSLDPKGWTVFDTCDVRLGKAMNFIKATPLDALITDCVTIVKLGDKVTVVKQRFHRVDKLDEDLPGERNLIRELHQHSRTRKLAGF